MSRRRSRFLRLPVEPYRVERGLGADDQLVINGLIRARPGAKVAPQEGTIAPQSDEPAAS